MIGAAYRGGDVDRRGVLLLGAVMDFIKFEAVGGRLCEGRVVREGYFVAEMGHE